MYTPHVYAAKIESNQQDIDILLCDFKVTPSYRELKHLILASYAYFSIIIKFNWWCYNSSFSL